MSSASPDSTCAIRRRTSASCALVISGEISYAKLSTNRSVSSVRASGGNAIASRKISSGVAMVKDYRLLAVCDKQNEYNPKRIKVRLSGRQKLQNPER